MLDTRGFSSGVHDFHPKGGSNSLGYEPYCSTPLAPKVCNFLRKQEIVRDISDQDFLAPLHFSTREPTTGAHHPRQTSTRPRVQHRHFLIPGRNLPRYPDIGVATTETFCASQQDHGETIVSDDKFPRKLQDGALQRRSTHNEAYTVTPILSHGYPY